MNKILNNLGLCQRARGLVSGTENVVLGLRNNKICYIFLASDASDSTIKLITDKAKYYNCLVDRSFTIEELSLAIGKENRVCIGITDSSFLKILRKQGDVNGEKK